MLLLVPFVGNNPKLFLLDAPLGAIVCFSAGYAAGRTQGAEHAMRHLIEAINPASRN